MKKILYIITQAEFGGAQRFIFNMATHLPKQQYEIMVAAGPEGDTQAGLLRALEKEGIQTRRLKHLKRSVNPFYELPAFFEIKKLIKEFKPNIVQLGSSKAGVLGSFAAHFTSFRQEGVKQKPKIITRIGGLAFMQEETWLRRKIYLWAEKLAQCCRHFLVVNSQYEKNLLLKKKIPHPEKIIVIQNGIDLGKLKFFNQETARNILEELLGGNLNLQKKEIVGTIANFYPAKDLETLVRAAKIVTEQKENVCFVIIGDGLQKTKIVQEIKNLGLENKVLLPGSIVPASEYLKAFNVFAFSSVNEGSPWAILEAMAAGLPIVTTNVAGIPEIIENGRNGLLVSPQSPEIMAQKIIELLEKPVLTARLSSQNLNDIENFTVKRMVEEFENLYAQDGPVYRTVLEKLSTNKNSR